MSGWDEIGVVVGGVLGGVIGGVPGALFGAMIGGDLPPDQPPQKYPPYPGTVPGMPPYPPLPPLEPPPANPAGQGQAHDAAGLDATQIAGLVAELSQLDQRAAAAMAAIQAAGDQGRRALDDIATSVDAKITELGPRLNTPQGQQELRDFLKAKLTAAKRVLDEQEQLALDKAHEIQQIAQRFSHLGTPVDDDTAAPKPHDGGSGPGGAPTGSDASVSTAPASSTDPAAAPAAPQTAAPPTTPAAPATGAMMPAMGMPMPMPSFGGMPGAGVGDPLSALSGLGAPAADQGLKVKDPAAQDDPSSADPTVKDPAPQPDSAAGHDTDQRPPTDAHTATAAADSTATPVGGPDTDVRLPDGTAVHASSPQAATAVRAALNGASVSQAYQQAGVTLPPAGSPVLDPIAPGKLSPGDVGVWKDHLVMALGGGKVLVSGQVQPQSSVGSGPDFLGWMRPVRDSDPTPPAQS